MEPFVSAVVGDLVSRFISAMIRRYSESQSMEEKLHRLQQLLLRIRTIVEEAYGRDITNEGMLLQLKMLMDAMYHGYFMLDTFKCRALTDKAAGDDEVRCSLALSDVMYPCKRRFFATSTVFGSEAVNELKSVLSHFESVMAHVQEFVIFLGSYPRMFRQPYSTYLFVDNCMFGRQIEKQRIINFLLQKDQNCSTQKLTVLPIIGGPRVGKRTLVEHACRDERVTNYYSSIVRLKGNDLKSLILTIRKGEFLPAGRCLFIIEFGSHVDEAAWRRFYSCVSSTAGAGSKLIITSKIDNASSFGTTQPLNLQRLSIDEFWYFFKVLAFGSSNADDHPQLASLAMKIATEFKGSFLFANIYGRLLRANFNIQFWCGMLECWKKSMQKNLFLFEKTTMDLAAKSRPHCHFGMGRDYSEVYFFHSFYSTGSLDIELPKIAVDDLITGNNIPIEKEFQVLQLKSLVPPYHTYIGNCSVKQKPFAMVSKKKRNERKSTYNL